VRSAQCLLCLLLLLSQAADYFFRPGVQGKRLRPTLLLLLASATATHPPLPEDLVPDLRPPHEVPQEQRRRQQRIAEIAELIHVASLMHDDVLDDAATRRGVLSLNAQVGTPGEGSSQGHKGGAGQERGTWEQQRC
jgi:geranyl diphosphate synthase